MTFKVYKVSRIVLWSLACMISVVTIVLASARPAKAVALSPDPGNRIEEYARKTLLDLPDGCSQSPGYTYWISRPFDPSIAIEKLPAIDAKPGQEVWLQFNWAGAVCTSRSGVKNSVGRLDAAPDIRFVGDGYLSMNWEPDIGTVGKYRDSAAGFYIRLPNDLPVGETTITKEIGIRRLNQFSNGAILCVRGSNKPSSIFNTEVCDTLPLKAVFKVKVQPPRAPGVATASANCQTLSGTVKDGDGMTAIGYLDGEEIGRKAVSDADGGFSFNVPTKFKDGVVHAAKVVLINGAGAQVNVWSGNQTPCSPNAQCVAKDFTELGSRVDAGDTYKYQVKLTYRNNGEAIWGNYSANNQYRLALTTGSDVFKVDSATLQIPQGTRVLPGAGQESNYTFNVTVTAKQNAGSNGSPLGFRMSRFDGVNENLFGEECKSDNSISTRSVYGPWLRTQNGNVTALKQIKGQDALTALGGNRGGRREVTANDGKDDLNKEATYLVISAVGSAGPFCSTNTYNLGRDTLDAPSPGLCTSSYALNIDQSRVVDKIYDNANTAYENSPTECPAGGPSPSGRGRYVQDNQNNGNSGNSLSSTKSGNCPTITKFSGDTLGPGRGPTGIPADSPARQLSYSGRRTIIVDGNLYISANIRRESPAPTVAPTVIDVNTLAELNTLPNLGIIVKGNITIDRRVRQIDAMIYATGKINTCSAYGPEGSVNNIEKSNGFKQEELRNGVPEKNDAAAECSTPLVVNGLLAAKEGFNFGRNYIDFAGIGNRIGKPVTDKNYEIQTATDYYGGPAEDIRFNGLALILPPPGFENITDRSFSEARYVTDNAQPRF